MYDYIIIQGSILVLVVPTFSTYLPKTAEDNCIIFWVEDKAKTMYYFKILLYSQCRVGTIYLAVNTDIQY